LHARMNSWRFSQEQKLLLRSRADPLGHITLPTKRFSIIV
jgi:hypothetical protein